MIVLDSSAAVEYLASLTHGPWVRAVLEADDDVHAPHLLDIEVVNAMRALVARRLVPLGTATAVLEDLALLDVARHPHVPMLERMWELRVTVAAGDASFVALAELLDAPLVTTDLRLARVSDIRAAILTP